MPQTDRLPGEDKGGQGDKQYAYMVDVNVECRDDCGQHMYARHLFIIHTQCIYITDQHKTGIYLHNTTTNNTVTLARYL